MGCPNQGILDQNIVFTINTRLATSGAPTDADSAPAYTVYENENDEVVASGTMTKPDVTKAGFYSETIALTTAAGFELYKTYTILVEVTVNSVVGNKSHSFLLLAEENLPAISDPAGGGTYGFTTLNDFQDKLEKLAADNDITFTADDRIRMVERLNSAYNTILEQLIVRGLTAVQVSTWARGEEFQLDIATYWYGRDSGWGTKNQDERDWIGVFNREEELKTVPVLNNSNEVLLASDDKPAVVFDLLAINEAKNIYT